MTAIRASGLVIEVICGTGVIAPHNMTRILLNIDGAARPVRTEPRSSRATDRALSIRSSASSRVSSITGLSSCRRDVPPGLVCGCRPAGASGRLADQRPDLLTCDRTRDVAVLQQVEHDDRHAVVHAEADGCR